MRTATIAATVALALVAGACTQGGYQMEFHNSNRTQAETAQDKYQCTRDAYAAGGLTRTYGGGYERGYNYPLFEQCMTAKGYLQDPTPIIR